MSTTQAFPPSVHNQMKEADPRTQNMLRVGTMIGKRAQRSQVKEAKC